MFFLPYTGGHIMGEPPPPRPWWRRLLDRLRSLFRK